MPAPRWFFRFMYDRESAAWERRRNEPEHRELVERTANELANVVAPPGPVADLGCGPGAHALALARRGYDVAGVDGSPRMVEAARARAARDKLSATFDVHDVSGPLRFADASLAGVLAILVLQHLPHPAAFLAEIRRCLRPGGHLLITAPTRDSTSRTSQNLYWRLRTSCYLRVPGVVRCYDTNSLTRLVQDQGLTVVECHGEPGRVSVLARSLRGLTECALQRRFAGASDDLIRRTNTCARIGVLYRPGRVTGQSRSVGERELGTAHRRFSRL
jgi:SAM-dependent methyltransferase